MKGTCSRHAPDSAWRIQPPERSKFGAYEILSDKALPWSKNRFGDTVMYWHLANFWPGIEPHHQLGVINEAWRIINFEINPLQYQATGNPDAAPVMLYWVDENDMVTMHSGRKFKSPFLFSESPSTLAVNFGCAPGHPHSQDGFINGSVLWTVGHKQGKYELLLALVHEFLHGLGLHHTRAADDILNAYYDPENWFTSDTRNGLKHLFKEQRLEAFRTLPAARYTCSDILGIDPDKIPYGESANIKKPPTGDQNSGCLGLFL